MTGPGHRCWSAGKSIQEGGIPQGGSFRREVGISDRCGILLSIWLVTVSPVCLRTQIDEGSHIVLMAFKDVGSLHSLCSNQFVNDS